ncbi:hypothetical protein V6L77_07050 [Pannonibacter sp. Pt2-lr]
MDLALKSDRSAQSCRKDKPQQGNLETDGDERVAELPAISATVLSIMSFLPARRRMNPLAGLCVPASFSLASGGRPF